MRVAITGASGFVGRRVAAALAVGGATPLVVRGDVCAPLAGEADVDVVCHLAGRAGARFHRDADAGLRVNVVGTLHALELARRLHARLVLASTCAVYRPVAGAVREDAPAGPVEPYGVSKCLAEALCWAYAGHLGVPVVVLRFFNLYGSGQPEEFVIAYLCRTIAESGHVRLRHPDSVRDFVHVDDVVEAVAAACRLEGPGGAFNIGSGVPQRIAEVAGAVADLMGRSLTYEREPAPGPDPYGGMWADLTRTGVQLGWRPRRSLADGLRATLAEEGWKVAT